MFRKLLRSQAGGSRGGGMPSSHSHRGTPPSSESKGKRTVSPSAGVGLGGSLKKLRMGSFNTPPSSTVKPPSGPLPPPALKGEKGDPFDVLAHPLTICTPLNLWS
ncbi:UNVERIFIED_CONTAM: hypothetical protein Sradi_4923500 [Sesamum radiatum]|uniref:Uncharacterized protein n=1 Tax=Sesamum radiatum TaxID=300843 RepID=A0AAW2MEH7_SESRA